MHIKITVKYHLIWSEWPSSKYLQILNPREDVEEREFFFAQLVGMQIDTATLENNMEISLKTRNKTTIWQSNTTTGHIPWENHNSKRHTFLNVHCSTVYNSQDTEATSMSTNRWIKKMWYIYTMEYYLAIKRNEFESVVVRWMNLEPVYRVK